MNTQQHDAAAQARRGDDDRHETGDESRDKDREDPKDRQEELLDEGVEETFPASDPVSVKRIT